MISTKPLLLDELPPSLKNIINNNLQRAVIPVSYPQKSQTKTTNKQRKRKSSPSFKIQDIMGKALLVKKIPVFRKIDYEKQQFSDLIGGISTQEALNGSLKGQISPLSSDFYSYKQEYSFDVQVANSLDLHARDLDLMRLGPVRLRCRNCQIQVQTEIKYEEKARGFWKAVCCGGYTAMVDNLSVVHVCCKCKTVLVRIQTSQCK